MAFSTTTGWRVFLAHLTDLIFWGYPVGVVVGFFWTASISSLFALTFVIALPLSFLVSARLFAIFGVTPTEWLWGCRLELEDPSRNRFIAYLTRRLCLNDLSFTDHNNSLPKNIAAGALLLLLAGIYCL